ncbi:Transcriptional regulator of yeast-form-adherence 3 [Grifola frondosa]|uniref:Transcriptional regulator of yeast-form-adherence 3 n=1 Tax=Grifola frondosa TaxID=5627 RepID=A0A1C7MKA3_GRIFR|nr:Transcriptional regulator of yeast-form-adherence 3 [Grifola frondosa]
MHFSKTYSQLLLTLPPELRESAIEYRQLKKLINQVVTELTSLGLSPEFLHQVIQTSTISASDKGKQRAVDPIQFNASIVAPRSSLPRVFYELSNVDDHLEPRLRLRVDATGHSGQLNDFFGSPDLGSSGISNLRSECREEFHLEVRSEGPEVGCARDVHSVDNDFGGRILPGPSSGDCGSLTHISSEDLPIQELIIPLVSDTAFFRLLTETLQTLATNLISMRANFESTLRSLTQEISTASRPISATSSFHPHSPFSSDPATVTVPPPSPTFFSASKSDLDTWREVFQLYIESDIFESHQERSRGERGLEDAEQRLTSFVKTLNDRVSSGQLKLRLKQSRQALQTFIQLNTFILDLRKFQHVTSEATRKILKKHAKRTALPLAPDISSPFVISGGASSIALLSHSHTTPVSLPLLLVQALTETLLPIIPHIDDYACIICTSIAFKPIRLQCGHLFCVRCLVKMQKRGEGNCPMCRATTVLAADRSNVDWALLNFMKDWFPIEAKKKLQQNEREAAHEEMEELGLSVHGCFIM